MRSEADKKRATMSSKVELGRTAIHYLPQIAEQIADQGFDVAAWLRRAGLDQKCLSVAGFELPSSVYAALLEDAVTLTGDTALGIRVGCNLPPSGHGILGLATVAAASVLEAMKIVQTYVPLRTSMIAIRTEVDKEILKVVFEPLVGIGDVGNIVSEIAVGTVKNIADSKIVGGSLCKRIAFAMSEPPHAELARNLLKCPVEYSQLWTGMEFGLAEAEYPFSQRDELVMSEALNVCRRELERLSVAHTIVDKVERLLLDSKGAFLTQGVCAKQLNLSSRTLHRRLNEEGTSFRDVLDGVRRRLAKEYLKSKNLGVKETAYLLGYRDTANFRRAFTRWYGFPPSKL